MIVSDWVADGIVFSCPSWVAFGVSLPVLLWGTQSIDCLTELLGSMELRAALLLFLFVVATDRLFGCVPSTTFLVGDLCLLIANWPDGSWDGCVWGARRGKSPKLNWRFRLVACSPEFSVPMSFVLWRPGRFASALLIFICSSCLFLHALLQLVCFPLHTAHFGSAGGCAALFSHSFALCASAQ
jgi:hypothetical protein